MPDSLDHPPIILQSSRWNARQIQYLALMLLVMAINIPSLFVIAGTGRFISFGLLALVAVVLVMRGWAIVRPPRLTLDPSGLTLRVAWRTRTWKWEGVRDFRPVQYARIEAVGFDFAGGQKAPVVRQINTSIAGAQAVLPGRYAMAPIELAGLLNHARERWAGRLEIQPETAPRRTLITTIITTYYVLLIGRLTRRAFWISLGVLAVVQVVLTLMFRAAYLAPVWGVLGCVFVCRGRFRDIGWPAVIGFVIPLVVMLGGFLLGAVMAAFEVPEPYVAIVTSLTVFVGIAPFGFVRGDPKTNRYGPPAGGERQAIESVFN